MPKDNLSHLRALILDMDGVVWQAMNPLGDLPAIFAEIDRRGWGVILATNNSTRTPAQYLEKLSHFGVHLEPWQIINSAQATAHHLGERYPQGGPVFMVGESGLIEILEKQGFYNDFTEALAVVVAFDRAVTYEKLRRATLLIRRGIPFIGTNPDRTFPTPEGQVPGTGAILAAIEAATGVEPIIIGKPQPYMYAIALQRLGTSPAETLVVGDRLETDIAGAQNIGCPCALVLSGVSTLEAAQVWEPAVDLIADDLGSLIESIPRASNLATGTL